MAVIFKYCRNVDPQNVWGPC